MIKPEEREEGLKKRFNDLCVGHDQYDKYGCVAKSEGQYCCVDPEHEFNGIIVNFISDEIKAALKEGFKTGEAYANAMECGDSEGFDEQREIKKMFVGEENDE